MIANNVGRGIAVMLLATSVGGCSHVGSMWSKLRGHDDSPPASAALAPSAPVEAAAAPAADAQVCETLRTSAAPSATTETASRQMAIDEMKRIGCPDVPTL